MRNMEKLKTIFQKHPWAVLYVLLPWIVAFFAVFPMFTAGIWEAALVDMAMVVLLTYPVIKNISFAETRVGKNRYFAWVLLAAVNILVWLPVGEFYGKAGSAAAFVLLFCAPVMYWRGIREAMFFAVPAAWCCVFIPYHEEIMLFLSYPLRFSAAMFSSLLLEICGVDVVLAGSSLQLPGLDIAITDACSGINQLDAFILIAFIAVQLMHSKTCWKILHFAFIIPSVIIGNSLRIMLTVMLYKWVGAVILQNFWHSILGWVQIILAFVIFIAVGKLFSSGNGKKNKEAEE